MIGALIAFMGVNIAVFVRYFLRAERRRLGTFLVPLPGCGACPYLWLSLGNAAKAAGLVWLLIGVLYGALRTSWFHRPRDFARISGEEEPAPTIATRTE